jgi:fatty acid desaturase
MSDIDTASSSSSSEVTKPSTRLHKWATEIRAIPKKLYTDSNMKRSQVNYNKLKEESYVHLNKIVYYNRLMFYAGYFSSFMSYTSVFPWVLMGISMTVHWAGISHHTCHGGYQQGKYNRFTYGRGIYRRLVDWVDWLLAESWCIEHNSYHHYKLNEYYDPDNVEHNLKELRNMKAPMIIKYLIVGVFGLTWRQLYYSSNSYKYYIAHEKNIHMKRDDYKQTTLAGIFTNEWPEWLDAPTYIRHVLLPVIVYKMLLLCPFIWFAVYNELSYEITYNILYNVCINMIMAEVWCNIHTFLIIVPNHAGKDMYGYTTSVDRQSDEWLLRQTISSTNYNRGDDITDVLHGWLNYQIEHHVYPSLSMREYQLVHKEVKAVCDKYGIPYVSENVFMRMYRTIRVMVGQDSYIPYEGSSLEKYVNEIIPANI